MENIVISSETIAESWGKSDFPNCLTLLQDILRLHKTSQQHSSAISSPLLEAANVLYRFPPRFDCVSKEHHAMASSCLDLYAEILRIAANLDETYAVSALRGLIERGRINEGLELLPVALRHPGFPDIASLACIALFGIGKKEEALSLLRNRLQEENCRYLYVTELVKIGRLTGHTESEFASLDQALHSDKKPTVWEIAYYSHLGIALQKQVYVTGVLNRLAAKPDLVPATKLACIELYIDACNPEAALSWLQTSNEDIAAEWRNALRQKSEQLAAAYIDSNEWQKAKASASLKRPKVALTLSGFVRSYEGMASLFSFLRRHVEKWDIEIFAQSFDRLGNLYMRTQNLGNVFYDYSHGGFYREIMKTPPLRIDILYALLSPICLQVARRQQDEHYIKSIGMAHPQWMAVWEGWQLFERHRAQTGDNYTFAIRGRYDKDYDHIDLDRLDLHANQIATPANDFYGCPP